jgi:hypothetical protein
MRARLAASIALLILAAGCGRGQDPTVEGGGASPSTTPTTASSPSGSLEGGATSPVSTPVSPRTLLRAVRVAGQPEADRVVFEFEGGLPGYRIRYVEPPITEDGSGRTVNVDGEAHLQVIMESASGSDISGEQVREVYTGADRVSGDTANVTEAVRTGDFEGVLTWVIGAKRKAEFRVSTLQDPSRLVIEIAR